MIIKSYAKINIALNVLGKEENGMHQIDTIMLPLELHDSLEIQELKANKDSFVTLADYRVGEIPHNIVTTALQKMLALKGSNNKFKININKNIPLSAGLGGGSSNAAATMLGIKNMLKLSITKEKMNQIAFEIGSDVPFFLTNVPARVRGQGEKIEPIFVKNNYYVLIVKPFEGLSTREVYEKSDELTLEKVDIDSVVQALKEGDDATLAQVMKNALEKPALKLLPEIAEIKEELFSMGFEMVLMSGSGSAVFAMSTDKKALRRASWVFGKTHDVELTRVLKGERK